MNELTEMYIKLINAGHPTTEITLDKAHQELIKESELLNAVEHKNPSAVFTNVGLQ